MYFWLVMGEKSASCRERKVAHEDILGALLVLMKATQEGSMSFSLDMDRPGTDTWNHCSLLQS